MQYIFDLIQQRQELISDLPQAVKNWILFMRIVFFSGVLFVIWWKVARWVLGVMFLTAASILITRIVIPDVDTKMVGTIVQLLLWSPLTFYLVQQIKTGSLPALGSEKLLTKVYGAWALLATGVLLVAFVLNLYQVSTWFF